MPARKSQAPKPGDEGAVISAITKAFARVDDQAARTRILQWAVAAYGDGTRIGGKEGRSASEQQGDRSGGRDAVASSDLGELIEQADPQDTDDRVLLVCFWLQENESPEGFGAQPVNDKMKDMGHRVSNITDKLGQLIAKKPAWIRQMSKSGKNRQARKKYKVTDAGRKRVQALLRGEATAETKE